MNATRRHLVLTGAMVTAGMALYPLVGLAQESASETIYKLLKEKNIESIEYNPGERVGQDRLRIEFLANRPSSRIIVRTYKGDAKGNEYEEKFIKIEERGRLGYNEQDQYEDPEGKNYRGKEILDKRPRKSEQFEAYLTELLLPHIEKQQKGNKSFSSD